MPRQLTPPDGLLGYDALRRALGVSRSWLERRVAAGVIPYRKMGRLVRFDREEIAIWTRSPEARSLARRRRATPRRAPTTPDSGKNDAQAPPDGMGNRDNTGH